MSECILHMLFHLVEIGWSAGYSIFIAAFLAGVERVWTTFSSSAFSNLVLGTYST